MELVAQLIRYYDIYIIMGLTMLVLVLLIVLIINCVKISKLSNKYRKFMRGTKDKNIEELLLEFIGKVDSVKEKSDNIKAMYEGMEKRLEKCVQKVSVLRYKAFQDMGGAALSFSIALLDAYDDGVILTGIYGRDECTTYAKPVDKGVPKYNLSEEEQSVLKDAIKKKI